MPIKRLHPYVLGEKEENGMSLASWVYDSHYWIENPAGYFHCKWCESYATSYTPIYSDNPLCPGNPAVKKLLNKSQEPDPDVAPPEFDTVTEGYKPKENRKNKLSQRRDYIEREKVRSMKVTVNIRDCHDCRHLDHSGAFTVRGSRLVCNHPKACEVRASPQSFMTEYPEYAKKTDFGEDWKYHWIG